MKLGCHPPLVRGPVVVSHHSHAWRMWKRPLDIVVPREWEDVVEWFITTCECAIGLI